MKGNILIIDDIKNIKIMLSKALSSEGYKVDLADNGPDGISLFKEKEYSLVLLDIRMPGMSGTEVLKALKDINNDVLVVIITAYPTVKNAVECIKLGAVDYLRKPFTAEKIRQLVKQMIERRKMSHLNIDTYEACIEYAKKCINERNFDEAVKHLKIAISKNIEDAEPFNIMGSISELKADFLNAIKYYSIALQLEPGNEGIEDNLRRVNEINL